MGLLRRRVRPLAHVLAILAVACAAGCSREWCFPGHAGPALQLVSSRRTRSRQCLLDLVPASGGRGLSAHYCQVAGDLWLAENDHSRRSLAFYLVADLVVLYSRSSRRGEMDFTRRTRPSRADVEKGTIGTGKAGKGIVLGLLRTRLYLCHDRVVLPAELRCLRLHDVPDHALEEAGIQRRRIRFYFRRSVCGGRGADDPKLVAFG